MRTGLTLRDHLKQVPEQLESLIGEKKFLQAALILVRSLKTINKPEIAEIGAVSDLRAYFVSQQTVGCDTRSELMQTLTDILVEELHSHVYLKTYYSDSRWRVYTPGQQMCRSPSCHIPHLYTASAYDRPWARRAPRRLSTRQ